MKRIILLSLVLIIAAVSMPLIFYVPEKDEPPAETAQPETTPDPSLPQNLSDKSLMFTALIDDQVKDYNLADYLPGAVAGEMPASFELEALKAQAVAARTYILCCTLRENPRHPEADVCNDPGCCKTHIEREALESMWADSFEQNWEIVTASVIETDGQYLSYEGEPIQAVFHSSSFGRTEDSGNIWQDIPYLISVDSPETSEDVPNFESTVQVTIEDFKVTVLEGFPDAELEGEPETWLQNSVSYDSGRIDYVNVGLVEISGSDMRSMFGLRSTYFSLEYTGDSFLFTCEGYGHGVGMSQYGSNVMAKSGSGYVDILMHYYPGTELVEKADD